MSLLLTIFQHNHYLLNRLRTGPSPLPQGWPSRWHFWSDMWAHMVKDESIILHPLSCLILPREAGLREGMGRLWAAQRGTRQDLDSFFASLISRSLPTLTFGPLDYSF